MARWALNVGVPGGHSGEKITVFVEVSQMHKHTHTGLPPYTVILAPTTHLTAANPLRKHNGELFKLLSKQLRAGT